MPLTTCPAAMLLPLMVPTATVGAPPVPLMVMVVSPAVTLETQPGKVWLAAKVILPAPLMVRPVSAGAAVSLENSKCSSPSEPAAASPGSACQKKLRLCRAAGLPANTEALCSSMAELNPGVPAEAVPRDCSATLPSPFRLNISKGMPAATELALTIFPPFRLVKVPAGPELPAPPLAAVTPPVKLAVLPFKAAVKTPPVKLAMLPLTLPVKLAALPLNSPVKVPPVKLALLPLTLPMNAAELPLRVPPKLVFPVKLAVFPLRLPVKVPPVKLALLPMAVTVSAAAAPRG